MGVHWKISMLEVGGFHEKQYIAGIALKKGVWTVCTFKKGLSKKERGGVFEGGLIP